MENDMLYFFFMWYIIFLGIVKLVKILKIKENLKEINIKYIYLKE